MSKKQSPLESAKVGKDNPKRTGWPKGSATAKKSAKASEAPEGKETPKSPESAPEEQQAAAETPEAAPIRRFKVLKKITVSMHGSITVLNYGSIMSSQHYGGMAGIEALIKSGVELEPIEE